MTELKRDLYKTINTPGGRAELEAFLIDKIYKGTSAIDRIKLIEFMLEIGITDMDEVQNCLFC